MVPKYKSTQVLQIQKQCLKMEGLFKGRIRNLKLETHNRPGCHEVNPAFHIWNKNRLNIIKLMYLQGKRSRFHLIKPKLRTLLCTLCIPKLPIT